MLKSNSDSEQFNLVADLGGTNIRFGLCKLSSTKVHLIRKHSIRDYESVAHLIKVYLNDVEISSDQIAGCCFAIAGPIVNQKVKMTNSDWLISAQTINRALGINNTYLINDFHAVALSVPHLPESGLVVIGDEQERVASSPVSVFGPGTGLGAALLVPSGPDQYQVIPTEGGHAGLSARTEEELKIFDYWRSKGHRINREFFVSGAGIERIFEALCVAADRNDYEQLHAETIQQKACNQEDTLCEKALNCFCALLGSAAGDQVLCTGSKGGMVLAGGILPRLVDFLQHSPFRKRFESKGVMSDYTKNIRTTLILEEQPGLIGAAAYLNV